MYNNHWRSRNKRTLTMQELAGGFNSGRLRTVLLRNNLEKKKYMSLTAQIERDKEAVRKKLQGEVLAYRKIYSDFMRQKQENSVTSLAQEDAAPPDKKTVLYQQQVARTRSGILEIFLGKRKMGTKGIQGKNVKAPSLKPNSPDSCSVVQCSGSDCSAATDL